VNVPLIPAQRNLAARALSCALAVSILQLPVTAVAAPADDVPPEVAALNERAVAKFQAKEYDEAIELFKQAYDLKPEPNYLFNIGRVYEQMGDMKHAVEFYTRFLKQPEVDLQAREVALERRRVLTAVLDDTEPGWNDDPEEVEDEPEDEPVTEPAVTKDPEPDPTPPPKKPNKLRISGYVLLGIGGGALIGGGVFAGLASAKNKDLDGINNLEGRDDTITKGKRNALVADVLFLTGGVLAITGLTLVLVSLKKKPSTTARANVAPAFGPHGAGLTAVMRF
jgi:tetratricopeptide (TPR) repeat protein